MTASTIPPQSDELTQIIEQAYRSRDSKGGEIATIEARAAIIELVRREVVGEIEVRPQIGPKRNGVEAALRHARNKFRLKQNAILDEWSKQ